MNTWKRWISAALAAALLLSSVPAGAVAAAAVQTAELETMADEEAATSGACGDNLTWQLDGNTLTIAGTGDMWDYGVTSHAPWYADDIRESIQTVIFDGNITSIGMRAFEDCENLTDITIPDTVTEINSMAFSGCSSLTAIVIPDGVADIGAWAFEGCSSLIGIILPDSVTYINNGTFRDCTNLADITIPDGVTQLNDDLFAGCTSLANIVIPDTVTTIGSSVFFDCDSLTVLPIPEGVTAIGTGTFEECDGLTDIVIPDNVTSIGFYAFQNCTNLTSVTLPDGLTSIGNSAFENCDSLTAIAIPDSVTSIGAFAFQYCDNLETVTLPDTLTAIESFLFRDCTSLTGITLPNSVTSIGSSAFSGCTGLTNLIIPDNVTSIGDGAFSDCTSLMGITIPDRVDTIGSYAFTRCSSLSFIDVSTGNTSYCSVDGVLFSKDRTELISYPHGKAADSYVIPDSVTVIADSAFYGSANLTSITIPNTITEIGSSTFTGCTSLTDITIPGSVTSIGDEAFYNCSSLTDVYYSGSEAEWEAIDISSRYNANSVLFSTTIHFNSTGPDSGEEEPAYITAVFTDYDAESGQVTLDGGTVTQYQVTEQTDTSFLDQLEALRGHDVLVHVAPTTDPWVWEIRSIVPVELHRGTLNAVDDASITLGGATYANHLAQYGRENPDILGQFMLYYVLDGAVVDYTLLTHETGSLRAWTVEDGEMTSVTIGEREYPARLDKPLFEASGSSAGLDAEYWIADGTIYAITLSSSSEDIYETKKLASYDAASGTAVFSDGTQYKASLSEEQQALIGQWVTVTKQSADAERITGLEKAVPELVLEITAQDEGDIYRKDGKYSYQETGPFEAASSFEIGYQVRVTNSFPYASAQALEEMAQDPALDLQVEDFRVRAPRDFNFGWTGGGEAGIEKSFLLHAGESLSGEGYVRPGLWYSPDAERDSLLITCAAETAAGGLQAVQDGFTIVDLDYEPPAASEDIEEQDKQIEASSEEAAQNFAASDAQIILNPNTMRELFGIQGERLDAFELELLTTVLMSSAPEKTFQEELDDAVLEKFFGKYKTDLTASSYTVPLTYQIQSPEYGLLTVTFECQVHGYSLSDDGIPYALDAAIGYEVVQQEENAPKYLPEDLRQDGQLGQIAAYDVERFAQSAYNVAEAEIKKHVYMDTWGNTANEVATILLDDTIQDILEATETTFADEFWKLIVWPTKEFTNACPTDLFIYDQNGDLKGAVEDGNITLDSTEFYLSVEDDVKTVRYLEDGYTIRYEATADGVMDVEVTEYLDANTPLRRVAFYQVPLSAGDVYEQVISTELLPDAAAYQLEKDDGSTYLPDDDERLFILHSDTEEEGGGSGSSGGGSGGGSGSSAGTPVTVEPVSHGKVTVTPQNAAQGSTVTITAEPEDDYRLQSLTVTDSQGKAIPVVKAADGTYTFTMPETDSVNVEAAFVPDIPGSTVEPFHDVDADAWYADAVQYVYEQGLMQGTDAGLFSPEELVNRGMVVTILYRLAGSPETDASMGFSDVEPDAYYSDAVRWASSAGIVTGYSAAAFGPEDTITREQLAAMLYRYVCAQGISVFAEPLVPQAFTDVSSISDYAAEAMAWAVDTGLMAGMPDGRLAPDGSATRAQTAVILMRLDEYLDTANRQP